MYDQFICDNIQYLRFSVQDTGCGIKEEDFKHLFKMFNRIGDNKAINNQCGAGLGLTICKKICTAMGGWIDCESVEGKGSKFTFTIALNPTLMW